MEIVKQFSKTTTIFEAILQSECFCFPKSEAKEPFMKLKRGTPSWTAVSLKDGRLIYIANNEKVMPITATLHITD